MRTMSVLLKPASGLCNMRCRYCFYADEAAKRETADFGMMSIATLRAVLTRALAETTHAITIAFQGGEPTLAGLPFFEQGLILLDRFTLMPRLLEGWRTGRKIWSKCGADSRRV